VDGMDWKHPMGDTMAMPRENDDINNINHHFLK
jgi:hypothetical protein